MSGFPWLAAWVGWLLACGLGAVWYSPLLFFKSWSAAVGLDAAGMKPAAGPFLVSLLVWAVAALAFAVLARALGAEGVIDHLAVAGLAWAGFIAPPIAMNNAFAGRPARLFWIDGGYQLAGLGLFGLSHALLGQL